MNWLAHLRLAPAAPLLRLGNLCGDFVRGHDLTTLHRDLQAGIAQHRAIDRFVDAHAVVRASRARLEPRFRRFSGVLVDVYYDHFLARDWPRHGDGGPLERFVAEVHADLRAHAALLPPRLQQALPSMEHERWLTGYGTAEGIEAVLQRMAQRVRRPTPLAEAGGQLLSNYVSLRGDFRTLWPELVEFAAALPA
jgi:acyl carrier protein phosphodiesterase